MSFKNKYLQNLAKNAGCYHCCKTFNATEVVNFTDEGQTALCPQCSVDAVVFDSAGFQISEENLQNAKKYWF